MRRSSACLSVSWAGGFRALRRDATLRLAGYPPNEFAGPEEERKGPTEHRRLYLGRTVSLSFPLPPLIAAYGVESASGGQ